LYDGFKSELLQTAQLAALNASDIHMKYFGKHKEIEHKLNEFDLVTNADKESEEIIIKTIRNKFAHHNVLSEEFNNDIETAEFTWIIDPLDGTTNYAHNYPQFCVSIGLMHRGDIIVGVVYDPVKNELFHAIKGSGAFLNTREIKVSSVKKVSESLLATGFPYDRRNKKANNMDYFEAFSYKAQAIRRPGSAALDLCYLACGRFDGFWELKLAPWDTAAGAIIVKEAGGIVSNFFSDSFDIFTKHIIASNPYIYDEMTTIIRETNPELPEV
jgi:myo-inositol-1(or 4)-monophosphatase